MSQWNSQYDSTPTHVYRYARTPPSKRSRTVEKCSFCRAKKQKCSYTRGAQHGKCKRCQSSGLPCSDPQLALKTKCSNGFAVPSTEKHGVSPLTSVLPHYKTKAHHPSILPESCIRLEDNCIAREALLLLAFQELLSMAIKELIEIAIDTIQPVQRNSDREYQEDNLPALRDTVGLFRDLSRAARTSALRMGVTTALCQAQEALIHVQRPLFHHEFSCGTDESSLNEIQATILDFYSQGHYGLAYILRIKLLQAGIDMTQQEEENLLVCRRRFTDDLRLLCSHSDLPIPFHLFGCRVFMPKILARSPNLAKEILQDDRPDYLGRQSFQVLSDAGASIKWVSTNPIQPWRDIHIECDELSLTSRPMSPREVNSADILGRTALHVAVRQGLIRSVMTLVAVGANMHMTCLNDLSMLHIAACQGNTNMIKHLIENDAYHFDLDILDRAFRTPFWYAARGSHIDAMNALTARAIRGEVNVEHEDLHGHSALAIAARAGRPGVLDRLFQLRNKVLNADVLAHPANEHLVFVYAIQSKNARCIKLVREHRTWRYGDDVWRKAIDYAAQHRDDTLRAELQSLSRSDMMPTAHNLSCTLQDPYGRTYPLTDLSVLMASAPWMQLSSTSPIQHE